MTRIWAPITEEYRRSYNEAKKLSAEELYERHTTTKMKYFPYIGVNMNYIDTLGCPYRMRGGKLSGCSMCDYQSEHATRQGSLLALREKDPVLYAKAVRVGFQNSRGEDASGNVIENVSGYDSLNHDEVPEELCDELFRKDLFKDTPFIYNIEARASTIDEKRLMEFKNTVANKKRVSIDFGVEVSSDWLRNQWLNKDVSNQQIINAVKLLHEYDFRAVGNVLLGLPGLTEEQMIEEFVNTVVWMDRIGIDKIVIHGLNRKKYTLQGYLYQKLVNDEELMECGLAQGEHTGIPWLFTMIRGLYEVYKTDPNLYKKTVMVRLDVNFNSITNQISYNHLNSTQCNQKYIDYVNGLAINKEYFSLPGMVKKMKKDPDYHHYTELLTKQKNCGDLASTIRLVAKKVAQSLEGDKWEELYSELIIPEELKNNKRGSI